MRVPGVLRQLLQALAAFARAMAQALEAAAGAPRPVGRSAALAALSERFPGAPEHWLRVIAERAPHLAEAIEAEQAVAEAPIAPPTRLRLAWPPRRRASPRPAEAAPESAREVRQADAAWPSRETTGPAGLLFAAPDSARERAGSPEFAQPGTRPRPALRLVAPAPDGPHPTGEPRPYPKRQPPPAPPAAGSRLTGPHSAHEVSTPTTASPHPTPFPRPHRPPPAPAPLWSDGAGVPPAAAWPDLPSRADRGPGAWSGGAARPDPVRPVFPDASPSPAASASWEPLGARSHQRPDLADEDQPQIGERATFSGREDARWPALPPAEEDEAADAPPAAVERHIREQEFGGWSG